MEKLFCTIITANYLPYVHVLYDSLLAHDGNVKLVAFISDKKLSGSAYDSLKGKNIEVLYYEDIVTQSELISPLKDKYADSYHDAFRWSMKPVLLSYLLKMHEKAIYLDSDLLFFNDFSFLFDLLDRCSVLLSPHWRSSDPYKDPINFELNFLDGMYNGGFVGASAKGIDALNYWAKCCLYKMERDRYKGLHDDQKYLDILPSRFEGIESISHRGCNVGNWNQIDCRRSKTESGEVLINDKYKIIFIHFTKSLFRGVFFGDDKLLMPHVEHYLSALKKYNITGIYEKLEKEELKRNKKFNLRKLTRRIYYKIKP